MSDIDHKIIVRRSMKAIDLVLNDSMLNRNKLPWVVMSNEEALALAKNLIFLADEGYKNEEPNHMKTLVASFTGQKTSAGEPINKFDRLVFWHHQEASRKPAQFVRVVEWSDEYSGFIVRCPKYGHVQTLHQAMNDPNCFKVTKESTE